ncbi:BID domain-containing T4SS effector, partial [Brucella intermedia]|uniref:BID domain-containing T4SS effector n=3 Tax=Brucella/Ochrobactrum group TaxID=2826938 RepID=UPI00147DC29A
MRNPYVFAMTSAKLREAGYCVEARAIAVNERLSWQGVHCRYEGMIAGGALPRFTVRETHDAGASGMLTTLERIEKDRLADRVLIGIRNGAVIYDNRLEEGAWQMLPGAADAVKNERNRVPTREELAAFVADWKHVLARMQSRKANLVEIEAVRNTLSEDLEHFRVQSRENESIARNRALAPLIPSRGLSDLTPAEVSERARASDYVQRRRGEVEQLCLIVFGRSAAMSDALSRIDSNPQLAWDVSRELRTEPGQFGNLVGEAGGWIRAATPDRQNAEASLPRLATAIEAYGSAVNYQQSRIAQEHAAEQRRLSVEVPMPSSGLAAMLQLAPQAQLQ